MRTAAPCLRSENELKLSLRITTCLFRAASTLTTRAIVTVSAKGTVSEASVLGTGVGTFSLTPVSGCVGGPLGWSPTATRIGPGVPITGFQN